MNQYKNLGRVDDNAFKESKSVVIAKLILEYNKKIKTHFLEMDRTPNFDGKLMILNGDFERITVEVQIKTIPESIKRSSEGEFQFCCDTKAMNCVIENVTFNPVVLLVVDTENIAVYYKILTKEFVRSLNIENQKTKTICFSEEDRFQEDRFIGQIYDQVKITETGTDCVVRCGKIRSCIQEGEKIKEENYQLVYQRNKVKGYFTTYKYMYDKGKKFILLSTIKMKCDDVKEMLYFQYDKDYIHINRCPSDYSEIRDTDIANIILEVAKEVDKPILYTNCGKPVYWFSNTFLWQLRAEQIELPWYLRY